MMAAPGLRAATCCLLLALAPAALADDCAPYVDANYRFQRGQTCVLSFCSGTCTNRYCNILPGSALDQTQLACLVNNIYVIAGAGLFIGLIIIIGVVACCCKSLCLCCNLCFSDRPPSRLATSVAVTNIAPQQPLMVMPSSSGYQPLATRPVSYDQSGKGYLPPPYPGADNLAYADLP